MRQKVTVTKTLTSSADAVWRVISDGTRVERWFEWVAETEVQDPGEGGIRIIRMKDGTSSSVATSLMARIWVVSESNTTFARS